MRMVDALLESRAARTVHGERCILPRSPLAMTAPESAIHRLYQQCLDAGGALDARRAAAQELAERAFVLREPFAWDAAHVVEWKIQRRTRLHPSAVGDVTVLACLYDAEERELARIAPTCPTTADSFWEQLDADLAEVRLQYKSDIEFLTTLDVAEWRVVLRSFIPSVWDFVRHLALLSLRLPHRFACKTFENLWDEAGRGDPSRIHRRSFECLMSDLGVELPDLDAEDPDLRFLGDVVPEVLAEVNCWTRSLRHPSPAAGLGALYVVECGVPWYYGPLAQFLGQHGLRPESVEYLTSHIEGDREHAAVWREMLREVAADSTSRTTAYAAAMEAVGWEAAAWRATTAMLARRRAGKRGGDLTWLDLGGGSRA